LLQAADLIVSDFLIEDRVVSLRENRNKNNEAKSVAQNCIDPNNQMMDSIKLVAQQIYARIKLVAHLIDASTLYTQQSKIKGVFGSGIRRNGTGRFHP
jgi:aromatic ring hydroxylase